MEKKFDMAGEIFRPPIHISLGFDVVEWLRYGPVFHPFLNRGNRNPWRKRFFSFSLSYPRSGDS